MNSDEILKNVKKIERRPEFIKCRVDEKIKRKIEHIAKEYNTTESAILFALINEFLDDYDNKHSANQ